MTDHTDNPELRGLSRTQRLNLALALLARPERAKDGFEALRRRFPSAPDSMTYTAAHHVYEDGADAVIDFLADAELSIRDPHRELDLGITAELLYHLYNWLQYRAVLPVGRQDLLDLVEELREFTKQQDWEAVRKTIEELDDILEGSRPPPDVIEP